MRHNRRVARLLPLAFVAVVLSACGGSSSAGVGLDQARAQTVAGGTARFTLSIDATIGGALVRSEESGAISFAQRQAHLYKLVPGGGLPQELILDGPYTYTNANIEAATHDSSVRPWTKLDTRRLSSVQRGRYADELAHVRALVYLADGVAHAKRVGVEKVGGLRLTHLRGGVDPTRLAARVPPTERRSVRIAVHNDYLDRPFPADFWLDDKGRVRRVRVDYRTTGGSRIVVAGAFSGFGAKLDLAPPPADTIQDITP